ncbi:MAG TPA: HAMP domain-containing sensor histidine kinase [Aestuariivirgaceae bacterium]|nr:HAMP domain-containing sensor histidine kinase [Aestuariivirgaceae bacterium]
MEKLTKDSENRNPAALPGSRQPRLWRGLAGKLLLLTMLFVMVGEVLIFVPSIANFRLTWLKNRIATAEIAALAVEAASGREISAELSDELLTGAGAKVVALKRDAARHLMLSTNEDIMIDQAYDLRGANWRQLIGDAFHTLAFGGGRIIGVLDDPPNMSGDFIEVALDETPLRQAMIDFAFRILALSVVLSLIVAALVLVALNWLMVRPIRRLTGNMVGFAEDPEDEGRIMRPSRRADEIGVSERQLEHLQRQLAFMLSQKNRLAALGLAVSKVGHDLRNMLSSAQLLSDRLGLVDDQTVRRVAPKLIASIGRAIDLCEQTLRFGRVEEQPPRRERFALRPLIDEAVEAAAAEASHNLVLHNETSSDVEVDADRDQLFRILMNVVRNAVQAVEGAMASGAATGDGAVRIKAWREGSVTLVEVRDNGPGVPERVLGHLFEPFLGSGRVGGTGLGLAISAELAQAHGGELRYVPEEGAGGAVFRLVIPDRVDELRPGRRGLRQREKSFRFPGT